MRTLHTTVIATALLALVAAPVCASADDSAAPSSSTPLAASARDRAHAAAKSSAAIAGRDIHVNEHFARAAEDHCQYEANVRGSLVRGVSGQFVPDLAIESNVHCLYSQGEHLTVRTLAGKSLSLTDLLRALADRGAVQGVADGRICAFTPTFAIDRDRLAVQSVTQSCEHAGLGVGPDLDQ